MFIDRYQRAVPKTAVNDEHGSTAVLEEQTGEWIPCPVETIGTQAFAYQRQWTAETQNAAGLIVAKLADGQVIEFRPDASKETIQRFATIQYSSKDGPWTNYRPEGTSAAPNDDIAGRAEQRGPTTEPIERPLTRESLLASPFIRYLLPYSALDDRTFHDEMALRCDTIVQEKSRLRKLEIGKFTSFLIAPPLLLFLLGFATLWIVAGFRAR
ncbi:MAG: hypothetical protein U1E45_14345 [Geminicoccaceae bacterium]